MSPDIMRPPEQAARQNTGGGDQAKPVCNPKQMAAELDKAKVSREEDQKKGESSATTPHPLAHLDDLDWEVSPEYLKTLAEKFDGKKWALFHSGDITADQVEKDEQLSALQSLMYDGETPETLAVCFKDVGNDYFADGPIRYNDAIISYTKGIQQDSPDQTVTSVLYSNRANVYLLKELYVDCINDCRYAIRYNPENTKAYFRAGKASYEMKLFTQALRYLEKGLQLELGPQERKLFLAYQQTAQTLLKQQHQKTQQLNAKHRGSALAAKTKLDSAFEERGIEVKKGIYNCGLTLKDVWIDQEGYLHWPCVVFYPETRITDIIEDVCESHCALDHLMEMFPGDRFPEWDLHQKYVHDKLVVYLELPSEKKSYMLRINAETDTRCILSSRKLAYDTLYWHVLVDKSEAHLDFEENERPETMA